jgi:predicted DNA binding CopG/RHH family protein
MSDDKTTIRVPDEDFAEAKRKKEAAGQTWAEYLTDDARGTPDADALAAALAAELDLPDFEEQSIPDFEDMKNANAAAIREELTVSEMGGQR